MRIKCELPDFKTAVEWVRSALDSRTATPGWGGVRFRTDADTPGQLLVSAGSADLSATIAIPAETDEDVDIVVHGRLLPEIVRLASGDVTLSHEEGNRVTLQIGRSVWKLPKLASGETPPVPELPALAASVPTAALSEALKKAAVAAAREEGALPLLTGLNIHVDPSEGKIVVAATDRFRLAVTDLAHEGPDPEGAGFELTVPAKDVPNLIKACAASDSLDLHYETDSGVYGYRAGKMQGTGRLLAGQYPNWRPLLPAEEAIEFRIELPAEDMANCVKRASLVDDGTPSVWVKFEPGVATITSGSGSNSNGQAEETFDISYDGGPFTARYNAAYLIAGLASCGDTFTWCATSEAKPVLLRDADGNHDYLLMPLKK